MENKQTTSELYDELVNKVRQYEMYISTKTLLNNIKHMENKQTAMQQLIKWMEDMSEVIPFDQGSCYDKAIELLQIEKEQIENARPQITSNCVIKEIADEDIKRKIKKEYNYTHYEDRLWMVQGAVWYREQLKKQQ